MSNRYARYALNTLGDFTCAFILESVESMSFRLIKLIMSLNLFNLSLDIKIMQHTLYSAIDTDLQYLLFLSSLVGKCLRSIRFHQSSENFRISSILKRVHETRLSTQPNSFTIQISDPRLNCYPVSYFYITGNV